MTTPTPLPPAGGWMATLAAVVLLVTAACSGAAAPSPSVRAEAPSPAPVATPTPTSTPAPTPTPTPTPQPTVQPGTAEAPRAILVNMTDELRYDPSVIEIRAGETVQFVVQNPTEIDHDFTVGDEMTQMHHEEEMAHYFEDGGMMHGNDQANAVLVRPGETAMLVMTFDMPGEVLVGCHIPGHYGAGMAGVITVTG